MTAIKQTTLSIFILLLSEIVLGQNYLDDKTFIGTWIELGDGRFSRVDSTAEIVKGLQLTASGEIARHTECDDSNLCSFKGSWLSLNMGHFSIQYESEFEGIQIIERFEYAENKNVIKRVGYEEYPLKQISPFVGKWILKSQDSDSIIYEKCENIESAQFAFHLLEDGSGTIFKTNKKNKRVEIKVIWWLGKEGDYIDMQFFNSITKIFNIEGFKLMPDTNPVLIQRTRFDEFGG